MKVKSIKTKITYRVLLIGIITFFISLTISYFIFVPSMKHTAIKKAEDRNKEIVQQINSTFNFVQNYIENLSLSVAQNMEILRYFKEPNNQNKNIAQLYLNKLISYGGLIRCVIIEKENVPILDSMNKVFKEDYSVLKTDWYQKLKKAEFGRGSSYVYQVNINGSLHYTVAYLKSFYHGNDKYIYTVFADLNKLIYEINVIAGDSLDYYVLSDSSQNVFYVSGNQKYGNNIVKEIEEKKRINYVYHGKEGIFINGSSVNSRWRVFSFISNYSIFQSFAKYMIGIIFVLLLFMFMTIGFLAKTLGKMLRPILSLSKSMEQVTAGNLECLIDTNSEDEIGRLSQSFNIMISDLKRSVEIIAEKEKKEQQARFSILISQINPHFIYNTINSINYLARRERYNDIIAVNSALIYILQDRLRINNIQITDSIENEIKVVEQYIAIEKLMYDGNLDVEWKVEKSLLSEEIPKNMIQPLVENALFHGLIDEETGELHGKIEVVVKKELENIIITVKDNGMGMDAERLRQVENEMYRLEERGKRVGLSNIRKRLEYLYGNNDCIKIESRPQEGTCITLILYRRKIQD